VNLAEIADAGLNPLDSVPLFVGALIIVVLSALTLPIVARLVRAIAPIDEEARVSWRFGHILILAAVFVASMEVVPALVPLPREGAWLLVLSSLAMLPSIAVATGFAWGVDPTRLRALGFRSGHFFTSASAGMVAYVILILGLGALALAWQWILARFGVGEVEQDVITALKKLQGSQRILAVVFGVAVQPFLEEYLFRGFLQPYFVQHLRAAAGIAVTSALFAILHGVGAFVPIFALSCLLGYVMMKTHRLHAVWLIHAVHNGIQFLFLYVIKEPFPHAESSGGLLQLFIP